MIVLEYSTNYAELTLLKNTSFEHAISYQKVLFVKYKHQLGIRTDNVLQYAMCLKVFKISKILRTLLHTQVCRNW